MKRSTVVGSKGDSVVDNYRTSYGTFIKRLHDPIIAGGGGSLALSSLVSGWPGAV